MKIRWGDVLGGIVVGQATAWVRAFIGGVMLVVAGVMLALVWVPLRPMASALHARYAATASADAEVIGHRYVCEKRAADQLALRGYLHLMRAEAGCRMRSEALLRYTDAAGATHDVVAEDPYGTLLFQGLTPRTEANPFERLVPLVQPEFLAEPAALDRLATVVDDGAQADDMATGSLVRWNQRQALELRSDDPLLFEALAWLGPPAETRVHLRYAPGDPEHAWLAGLFDQAGSERVPWQVALVLVPIASWIVWNVVGFYTIGWRREIGIAITALAVFATPFWAPRFYGLVEYFSADGEVAASLREDFDELDRRTDLRTGPEDEAETVRVVNGTAAGVAQAAVLASLIPARPARTFANLGQAYEALCEAAGARFDALPREQREARYNRLSELLLRGVNGPPACLFPVVMEDVSTKRSAAEPLGEPLLYLLRRYSDEHPAGSSFALDYERDRNVRKRATEMLIEEERRGASGD